MGVDLCQWRAAIGSFRPRSSSLRPRPGGRGPLGEWLEEVRKKGEDFMRGGKELLEEVGRGWRSKTCNLLQMVLYLVICSSMVGVVVSGVLTYSYLDAYNFSTASCSTITSTSLQSSHHVDPAECVWMLLQVVSVVRMLLLMAGVESHPGPTTFRAYLVHDPQTIEPPTSTLPSLVFSDGNMNSSSTNVFMKCSSWFEEMVTSLESGCEHCPNVVHLQDFETRTGSQLVLLLTLGETYLESGEMEKIRKLQGVLGCSGVSKLEVVNVDKRECPHCFR